jgi:hypothetical protein
MENQPTSSRRVVRQAALNQPPIKIVPEGGYHRDWKVTKKSHASALRVMAEKNQARKDLADQKVMVIVQAWEAQPSLPPRVKGKFAFGCILSDFSKTVGLGLSYTSLEKRHKMWCHLHD